MPKKFDTLVWTPADWHCGSNLGLHTPSWTGGDGITILPSTTQKVVRDQHLKDLKILRGERKNKRLVIIFAGDAIDGNHHNTTQITTPDENEHAGLFTAVFDEALEYLGFSEKNGDRLYFVKGTRSHVGNLEETIAKYYYNEYGDGAVRPIVKPTAGGGYKDGRFLREHLFLDINGVLFDVAHDPSAGPGTRMWTKANSIRSLCTSIYMERLDRGEKPYKYWYWIRAHRHRFAPSGPVYMHSGTIEGVILPAKQGKTEYGNRVAADHLSDIGDVWFSVDRDGRNEMRYNIVKYDRDFANIERI